MGVLEVRFWGVIWTHLGLRTEPFPHKKEWNGMLLEESMNPSIFDIFEIHAVFNNMKTKVEIWSRALKSQKVSEPKGPSVSILSH